MSLLGFKLIRGYDNDINLNMRTVEVREGRRTIRAQWSPEMVQDIAAYHNIDIEQELTRVLSEEIGLNVQRVFARAIAQDLVPVQPLHGPRGILHYLDYVYDGYNFKNFKLLTG